MGIYNCIHQTIQCPYIQTAHLTTPKEMSLWDMELQRLAVATAENR